MLAKSRRRWPSITSALGKSIVLSSVSGAGVESITHITMQQSEKITQCCRTSVEHCGSTLKQHWVNATCLCKVYSRPIDGLVLGQRRIRPTGIEPAMGCDAGPTLNRNLMGRQVLNECWPAPAIVNTRWRYILIFSLVLSLIISKTFRILAHEEDQYTVMFRKY